MPTSKKKQAIWDLWSASAFETPLTRNCCFLCMRMSKIHQKAIENQLKIINKSFKHRWKNRGGADADQQKNGLLGTSYFSEN